MTALRKDCLWRIEKQENKTYAMNVFGECLEYQGEEEVTHGDIILERDSGRIQKLHDASSSSALVYITNQCNSNCVMCPDSAKQRSRQSNITEDYLKEYLSLLPSDLEHVDITGGEPTLLKDALPEIIEKTMEQTEHAEILMLSNGRSFAVKAYTERFAGFSGNRFKIEIPIHSADEAIHDYIAGCLGSFKQTVRGIHNLLACRIQVGIRIVVSKLNYQELERIIHFIHREFPQILYVNIMGMEVLGNAWKNRENVWVEFEEIKPYLENGVKACIESGLNTRLYNFPLCLFEERYWYCYKKSISDYKIRYFPECGGCREKEKCGGFFFSTFRHTQYKVKVQV